MTAEPFVLSLNCPRCHGAVDLQFSEWANDAERVGQDWTCPYCQHVERSAFPGTLAWTVERPWSDVDTSPEAMAERLREKRR